MLAQTEKKKKKKKSETAEIKTVPLQWIDGRYSCSSFNFFFLSPRKRMSGYRTAVSVEQPENFNEFVLFPFP